MQAYVPATSAARYQDISMNPQKLAGQCAKLKCCINFEVDTYVEAQKRLPSREITLETKDSTYYYFKVDIFKREITYSTDKSIAANLVTISANRAFEVINMNKKGIKPGFSAQRHLITNFDWLVINRIWILGGQNKFLKLRQGIGHFAIASSNNQMARQRPPAVLRYIGARFLHPFTDRRKRGIVRNGHQVLAVHFG